MKDREILENYRVIVIEIETLERQSKFLSKYIGGPQKLRAIQITGMPRGTNDPEAAILQQEEPDIIRKIEKKCTELREMLTAFEEIVNRIMDRRLQTIIRNYYALGETDERIAELIELSVSRVNELRNEYINSLN